MLRLTRLWLLALVVVATLGAAGALGEIQRQERETEARLSSDAFVSFLKWIDAEERAAGERATLVGDAAQEDAVRSLIVDRLDGVGAIRTAVILQTSPEDILEAILVNGTTPGEGTTEGEPASQRAMALVGPTGEVLGSTGDVPEHLGEFSEVRRALLRGSVSDGAHEIDGSLYFTAAAPVVYEDRLIIGAVWYGETLRPPIRNDQADYDVIILAGDRVVASSLSDEDSARLGEIPAVDTTNIPLRRAGEPQLLQRDDLFVAAVPTTLRVPVGDTPDLTALVVVRESVVPLSPESLFGRFRGVDLLDRRLWAVGGAGCLLFLFGLAVTAVDGRLLRRRVTRDTREEEHEKQATRVFDPDTAAARPKPAKPTPALASLASSAVVQRATGEVDRAASDKLPIAPDRARRATTPPPDKREPSFANPAPLESTPADLNLSHGPADDFMSFGLLHDDGESGSHDFLIPPPAAKVLRRTPSGGLPVAHEQAPEDFKITGPTTAVRPPPLGATKSPLDQPRSDLGQSDPVFGQGPIRPGKSNENGPPSWLLNTMNEEQQPTTPAALPESPGEFVGASKSGLASSPGTRRDHLLKELLSPLEDPTVPPLAPLESQPVAAMGESAHVDEGGLTSITRDPYKDLFEEFISARIQCGQSVDHLRFEDFCRKVEKKENDFKTRHDCARVELEVFVRDGKVGLKARPAA